MKYFFTFPYPPSVNHYYVRTRFGMCVGRRGKAFRQEVKALSQKSKPITPPVKMLIYLHAPDSRRRDLDNILKALLDAMEHAGIYENDSQICDLHVVRGNVDPDKKGFVHVEISSKDSQILDPIIDI